MLFCSPFHNKIFLFLLVFLNIYSFFPWCFKRTNFWLYWFFYYIYLLCFINFCSFIISLIKLSLDKRPKLLQWPLPFHLQPYTSVMSLTIFLIYLATLACLGFFLPKCQVHIHLRTFVLAVLSAQEALPPVSHITHLLLSSGSCSNTTSLRGLLITLYKVWSLKCHSLSIQPAFLLHSTHQHLIHKWYPTVCISVSSQFHRIRDFCLLCLLQYFSPEPTTVPAQQRC